MANPSVTYVFVPDTLIKASEANTNFQDIIDFLTNQVIQKDASVAFTATPSGPATDPTAANQFARKAYVDALVGGYQYEGGVANITTNSSGYATITHGLDFTPTGVLITPRSPISGPNIAATIIADSFTASTYRIRAIDNTGDALNGVAVTFSWLAFGPI